MAAADDPGAVVRLLLGIKSGARAVCFHGTRALLLARIAKSIRHGHYLLSVRDYGASYHMTSPIGEGAVFRLAIACGFYGFSCLALCALASEAQDADALSNYFTGREEVVPSRLLMPGTSRAWI